MLPIAARSPDLGDFCSLSQGIGGKNLLLLLWSECDPWSQGVIFWAGAPRRPNSNLAGFGQKPAGWKPSRETDMPRERGEIKSQTRWLRPGSFFSPAQARSRCHAAHVPKRETRSSGRQASKGQKSSTASSNPIRLRSHLAGWTHREDVHEGERGYAAKHTGCGPVIFFCQRRQDPGAMRQVFPKGKPDHSGIKPAVPADDENRALPAQISSV